MSANLNNIKDQLQAILNEANTTTASTDLSSGLTQRVQKVLQINPARIPISASWHPFVTVFAEQKKIELPMTRLDQTKTLRKSIVELKIVGAVWDSAITDAESDGADDACELLMENAEQVIRENPTLNKAVLWHVPGSVTYHNAPLDEGVNLRYGILTLQCVSYYSLPYIIEAVANSFETISTPSGTSPVADSSTDTLTLSSTSSNLTITGTAATDSIAFGFSDTPTFTSATLSGTSGALTLSGASGANIVWNTDGAGRIGAAAGSRPSDVDVTTSVAVNRPSGVTGALVISNGSGSSDIAAFYDNTTLRWNIIDGGYFLGTPAALTATQLNFFKITGSFSSLTQTQYAVRLTFTASDSANGLRAGYICDITGGYSGANGIIAAYNYLESASTGNHPYNAVGSFAAMNTVFGGNTSGIKVGSVGIASNSGTGHQYGVIGITDGTCSGQTGGVLGIGDSAGAGIKIGVAGLLDSDVNARPNASAAVLANNGTATTTDIFVAQQAGTTKVKIAANGNIICAEAARATNATDGFLYVPTCAGAPTGTPTSFTGVVALIFDTTNNDLYVYDTAWLKVDLA